MVKLDKGEHKLRTVRKHWFILIRELFVLSVALVLPFLIAPYIFQTLPTTASTISSAVLVFVGTTWVLFVWMKMLSAWIDYFLDLWVITDKRVVDIEQFGFFRREVSSFRMERIQDVTFEIRGPIATLLNFGDLHVQTAGESREFVIRGVASPEKTKELILRQHDRMVEQIEIDGGDSVYTKR